MSEQAPERFEQWAILELMGHRRLAGMVTEQTIAGAAFLRIDVPASQDTEDITAVTQWYSPAACVGRVAPVSEWEIRSRIEAPAREVEDDSAADQALENYVPF